MRLETDSYDTYHGHVVGERHDGNGERAHDPFKGSLLGSLDAIGAHFEHKKEGQGVGNGENEKRVSQSEVREPEVSPGGVVREVGTHSLEAEEEGDEQRELDEWHGEGAKRVHFMVHK